MEEKQQMHKDDCHIISTIQIQNYHDLDKVENEIRRLLHCSNHRLPVCLTAEPYCRFRCSILENMLVPSLETTKHDDEEERDKQITEAIHLEQGLFAKAKFETFEKKLNVSLYWQHNYSATDNTECTTSEAKAKSKNKTTKNTMFCNPNTNKK